MQLCLLCISFEYIEEIGNTFPLRKSFHKVWIGLNTLHPLPAPISSGVGTTQASPVRSFRYSGHSHWIRDGFMGGAGPIRVLPETFLFQISGRRALLSEAKLDSGCWQLFLP